MSKNSCFHHRSMFLPYISKCFDCVWTGTLLWPWGEYWLSCLETQDSPTQHARWPPWAFQAQSPGQPNNPTRIFVDCWTAQGWGVQRGRVCNKTLHRWIRGQREDESHLRIQTEAGSWPGCNIFSLWRLPSFPWHTRTGKDIYRLFDSVINIWILNPSKCK